MNSIRGLLLVFMGFAHMVHAFDKLTVDISNGKPALIWSVDSNQQNMIYFQNNNNSQNSCFGERLFSNHNDNFQKGYTIDLQGEFPVHDIIVHLATPYRSIHLLRLDIYIDEFKCNGFKLKPAGPADLLISLNCTEAQGRTVTVVSWNQTICHLNVLVCGTGVTGPNCDKPCSSSYGISCSLPCHCKGNGSCDKSTGYCKQGCSHSEGNRFRDCYFKSIEMNKNSFFQDFSQENRLITTSFPFGKNTKSCYNDILSKTGEGSPFWIEWKFSSLQTLKAVEFVFNDDMPILNATMTISIDNKPCLSDILQTSKVPIVHQCHNSNLQGQSVRLTINKMNNQTNTNTTGDSVSSICRTKLLGCHPGYFGPQCRLPCNCLVLPCHPETGQCADNRCMPGYKGPNCAQIDLTKADEVFTSDVQGSAEELPALFPHGPTPYPRNRQNTRPLWTTIRSFQLTGTFRINHVTVTIDPVLAHLVSNVSVYMDTEPRDNRRSRSLYDKALPPLAGLPCMESYATSQPSSWSSSPNSDRTAAAAAAAGKSPSSTGTTTPTKPHIMLLECPADASVVSVVAMGTAPLESTTIRDVGVWTCMDGTFGLRCDRICNCRHPQDVCDKVTGGCLSKCPPFYRGENCQDKICAPGRCKSSCSESGSCYQTCLPGWIGAACDAPCPDGHFGDDCLKTCYWCHAVSGEKTCDAQSGLCLHGCEDWTRFRHMCANSSHVTGRQIGHKKEQLGKTDNNNNNNNNNKIFAVAIINIVFICGCFIIVVMCGDCRRSIYHLNNVHDENAVLKHDNMVGFKTIHEGWQWVESMNRMRGFDLAGDPTIPSDLSHIQKVAIWIIVQNFEEGIAHRRQKLASAVGSVSETTGSQNSVTLADEFEDF